MKEYEWKGYVVGDADAAGAICGTSGETYQAYTRRKWVSYRNPPTAVTRDLETGRKMYPLRLAPGSDRVKYDRQTVEDWHRGRPGSGYWGKHVEPVKFVPVEKDANDG